MKYVPTISATVLILIAVLIPGSNIPNVNVIGVDKLAHFILFFNLGVAFQYDFPKGKVFIIVLIGLVFSFFTELLQLVAEDRSFDWYDMAADTVGMVFGLLMASKVILLIRTSFRF